MKPVLISLSLAASAVFLASAGLAAGMLADAKGMTLYTFDKDTKDTSNCYDACATMWPPYLATKGEKPMGEGWTMTKRKDGAEQWVYDGKPLYFFAKDMKAGEAMGDGFKGVWHVVKE
jgi:predicted lipoprotein with Yx(FWY)xxD motif